MTPDPPETDARLPTWRERRADAEAAIEADYQRFRARALAETGIDADKVVLGAPLPKLREGGVVPLDPYEDDDPPRLRVLEEDTQP